MKDKRRSAADVSRELIIDSIVLTKEVLHSIQNKLPIPLDNIVMHRIEATAEFESYERPEAGIRLALLVLLLMSAVALFTLV